MQRRNFLDRSAINLSPVADAQNADDDAAILDVADDAPVADAVFPVVAQLRTGKRFADLA
ncbi:MAG: hypothetical protein R3E35_09215 [Rhodocyclaceae bacterium]